MSDRYFNYQHKIVANGWDRWSFVRHWWRFYKSDPKLAPPYYPALHRELNPNRNPHLARLNPLFVQTEAMRRRDSTSPYGAEFLLRWLSRWPLSGWLAEVDDQPVGFVLLQLDLAPRLRLAKGGRNLLWRVWLMWACGRPVRHGRVPFTLWRCVIRLAGLGYRQSVAAPSLAGGPAPRLAESHLWLPSHHGSGRKIPKTSGRRSATDVSVIPIRILTVLKKFTQIKNRL